MGILERTRQKSGVLMNTFFVALGVVLAARTPAYAYLDAGTGSMLIQLLLGGFAGLAVIIKMYWGRLRNRLRPGSRPKLPKKDE